MVRRTLRNVTIQELEWCRKYETNIPPPKKRVEVLVRNLASKMHVYEMENATMLIDLYEEDYNPIFAQIELMKGNSDAFIDWLMKYEWDDTTYSIVLGGQMVKVWDDTLCPMDHKNMRASMSCMANYLSWGLEKIMYKHGMSKKYNMTITQALIIATSTQIIDKALEIAITQKGLGKY